jgi:CheY-like chemotaxis protein
VSKGNILIVEDNMDNYELVRFVLERNGYNVFLAVNGRDGVDAARLQKPDLILMDLALPEMDGWDATARIKQDPETKHIPLVALTVHTLPADRKRAIEAGVDAYLTKPINMSALIQVVNKSVPKKQT